MDDFYDRTAPLHHLVFHDWEASIARQADQLTAIIRKRWGTAVRSVLDVSCGIGTQVIGLAQRGFVVTASDLSAGAVARARAEAQSRALNIDFSVCDMRSAAAHHGRDFDVVISADNSITHLMTEDDLRLALRQMYDCTRPGGGCLITVRDYDIEARGTSLVKPYGVRHDGGRRYVIFQVWDFVDDRHYEMTMYFVVDDGGSGPLTTQVMRTKYHAVGTDHLMSLMREVGFTAVERLDGAFYQPVLLGDRRE